MYDALKIHVFNFKYRVVAQPLDPADEVSGDALERGHVDCPVHVEVGAGGRRREGAEDERGVVQVRRRAGDRLVADQRLEGATWKNRFGLKMTF